MNYFWAVVLGAIQGITEFLPVSSSGHLVLVQELIPNFTQPGVFFDTMLHAGTLVSVIYVFWKSLMKLDKKYIYMLFLGSIPAGLVGIFLNDYIEILFGSTKLVSVALIVTGFVNLATNKLKEQKQEVKEKSALTIGIAQALAIIPGISRSGSTIYAGVARGVSKEQAAEFSFLLSIPAVLGANLIQFAEFTSSNTLPVSFYLAGFVSSVFFGVVAIKLVLRFLKEKRFDLFGYYCLLAGLVFLLK